MICKFCGKDNSETAETPKIIIKSTLGDRVIAAGNARARGSNKDIDKIVLHSQGVPDNFGDVKALSSISNWFTSPRATGKSSAHYFVNFNGDIHLLVPEDAIAYHAGSQGNKNSIGVEVAGATNRTKFTDAQVTAVRALIADIRTRHNIKTINTHADFGKPGCPFKDGSANPFIKELNALLK